MNIYNQYRTFLYECRRSFASNARAILIQYGGIKIPTKNMLRDMVEISEFCAVEIALSKTKGVQLAASDMLGINRNTLRKLIKKHNIDINRFIEKD